MELEVSSTLKKKSSSTAAQPCCAGAFGREGRGKFTSGQEAVALGLVGAADEAHEFGHDIAVEVGRTETVLRHSPPRREHHKIGRHPTCSHTRPTTVIHSPQQLR